MRILAALAILFADIPADYKGLLINEISPGSNPDWVELVYTGSPSARVDISRLHVTMYYGGSESLSEDPVSIYSYDRPETPYDDRFVVVYPARPGVPDENDRTGDTNQNGIIEVYCANYYASFWNTDCAVAIDTDGVDSNGGIIDFCVFSNNDGSLNEDVSARMLNASLSGEWVIHDAGNPVLSAVLIHTGGLENYMSISRRSLSDTDSSADFYVSKFQTPGRPNIEAVAGPAGKIFSPVNKRVTVIPGDSRLSRAQITLTVYERCDIKIRIFSSNGRQVYRSPLASEVNPGKHVFFWDPGSVPGGLYICRVEASDSGRLMNQNETVMIILSRYR